MAAIRLGVIGFGERAQHMARIMGEIDPSARLTAIADPRADSLCAEMRAEGREIETLRFYNSADEMLAREPLDGVLIGTRCSLHTTMALKVLKYDLALFLEKPIATTMSDLLALRSAAASKDAPPKVVVSFPLRMSALVQLARKIIASGRIGTVEHVQAWNNVPYGDVYFQSWYRDENETQGLFLQKATHDLDYVNYLLGGNRPMSVSAVTSKRVFRGTHPAGLRCMDCAERTTCYESPYHRSRSTPIPLDQPAPQQCAFAVDTGNEDSGSALVQYESGMHVVYSQNFFARHKAARRGATLIGYDGTIEFDWYPERLQVFHHHSTQVETHEFGDAGAHGGGDHVLAQNFLQVIRGEAASVSPLDEALLNTLLCLKAKESAATHRFQTIEFPHSDF